MRNFANKVIQFEADEENSKEGDIICRFCGKKVRLSVRLINFMFVTASKVNIKGVWCNHSALRLSIEEILKDSSETVENNGYF